MLPSAPHAPREALTVTVRGAALSWVLPHMPLSDLSSSVGWGREGRFLPAPGGC